MLTATCLDFIYSIWYIIYIMTFAKWPRQFKWLLVLPLVALIWALWAWLQPSTATAPLAHSVQEAKAVPSPRFTVVVTDPPPPPIKPLQQRLPDYFRNPLPPDAPPSINPTAAPPLTAAPLGVQGSATSATPVPVAASVPAAAKAVPTATSLQKPIKATAAVQLASSPLVQWAQSQQLRLVSTAIGDQRVATLSTLAGEATFIEGEKLHGEIWLFKVYSDHVVLKQQAFLLEVR